MCLGIPARVVDVALTVGADDLKMATVEMGGVKKLICIEHVPDVVVGDHVLVHVGFALARIDEAEAAKIFALLEEMGELGA